MSDAKEKPIIPPYLHQAKYYETDQMTIVHHSNYIRWFEEARLYYLEQLGLGYDKIEAAGIYSPVLGVNCRYKSAVRFNETVKIMTYLRFFDGVKMNLDYEIIDAKTNKLRVVGSSEHCFVTKEFKPVSLKKDYKEMYQILFNGLEEA